MTRSLCRLCNAPLRWVRSEEGKRMPLDAEPAADGNIVVTEEGVGIVLGGRVKTVGKTTLWRSHFASCPRAAEARGGGLR